MTITFAISSYHCSKSKKGVGWERWYIDSPYTAACMHSQYPKQTFQIYTCFDFPGFCPHVVDIQWTMPKRTRVIPVHINRISISSAFLRKKSLKHRQPTRSTRSMRPIWTSEGRYNFFADAKGTKPRIVCQTFIIPIMLNLKALRMTKAIRMTWTRVRVNAEADGG